MPTDAPATRRQATSPNNESLRLKKRESDRKAQRISRERTKSRIAYLEDLVQKLSSGDDNGKTLSLMAQLSEVTEQRDSLVRFLDSTSSSLTKRLSDAKNWESRTSPEEQPQPRQRQHQIRNPIAIALPQKQGGSRMDQWLAETYGKRATRP
uniref:BZIP domain-containing protein n=1 Tax=Fusarium oxysporum (strain Fo5176) TaxID=660025 RepID=A0A0C4DJ20_FUSOF